MMKDYITIGAVPCDEPCAQIGQDDYDEKSRRESKVFVNMLRRVFGEEPGSARISIKSFQHDFGSYREVVCYYEDDDEEAFNYALHIENNTPQCWDEEALKELKND